MHSRLIFNKPFFKKEGLIGKEMNKNMSRKMCDLSYTIRKLCKSNPEGCTIRQIISNTSISIATIMLLKPELERRNIIIVTKEQKGKGKPHYVFRIKEDKPLLQIVGDINEINQKI